MLECFDIGAQGHTSDVQADVIRENTMILFEKRRKVSKASSGFRLPTVIHQLKAATKRLAHLKVTKGGPEEVEVTMIYNDEIVTRHVVYLAQHSCTCREW